MLKAIIKFFKALNSNVHPGAVAHAVCLGMILGFLPKTNALWYILTVFFLFVRINNKQIFQTRTTRGVIAIVSSNHSIIQVPDREIEAIRRFEASQRKIHLHETAQLVKGAEVTILSGEFAGMQGRLIKDCKDGNFSVQISALNISFVVQVKRSELRPPSE